MADNVNITPGAGTPIAADDIGGIEFQRIKLIHGADGVNAGDVSTLNGLPIQGMQSALSSTAWTSATALNTANSISVVGMNTVTAVVIATSTITGGVLTFEVSPDGTNWVPISMARIDSFTVETTYTLVASLNRAWATSVDGFTNFRVRLSTAITGTATVTVLITAQTMAIEPIITGGVAPLDGPKATYSAASTSAVATAFPIGYIQGSASKLIRINRITVEGTQTTGAVNDLQIGRYSTAPGAGTGAAVTSLPHDSTSAAATAVVQSYSVAPTSAGTLVAVARRAKLFVPATTAAPGIAEFTFGDRPGQALVLRGTGQYITILPAAATGAAWAFNIEWTEE